MDGYVYKITNDVNGKYYVGSTIDPKSRMTHHFASLRNGTHHSIHLQRAFNKYGEEHFHFEIIETCDADKRLEREQYYLDQIDFSGEECYNESPIATNCVLSGEKNGMWGKRGKDNPNYGRRNSEEVKKKISESAKKVVKTKEWRENLSKSKKELYASGKLVSWNKGKHPVTDEQKEILRKQHSMPVICYDLETGEYVKTYNSGKEAVEDLGYQSIHAICRKKLKSKRFYHFRYKNDIYNEHSNIFDIEPSLRKI